MWAPGFDGATRLVLWVTGPPFGRDLRPVEWEQQKKDDRDTSPCHRIVNVLDGFYR